jgi:hypothetical protein
MRQSFSAWMLLALICLVSFPVYAQKLSVSRFSDNTSISRCPQSDATKTDIDVNLQAEMANQLMELERFEIREREVRPLKAKLQLKGSVRTFEVCPITGSKGQDVEIVLDVQMLNAKGNMTHMFTSSAKVSHTGEGKATGEAIRYAIKELVARIDNAIPKIKTAKLPLGKSEKVAKNDYKLQMIRKPSSSRKR